MDIPDTINTELIKRFPIFELSYETIVHKKVSPSYNLCLAIPQGKKCYIWFTYIGEENVCLIMQLNKEKKIVKTQKLKVYFDKNLSLGTIFYGTVLDNEDFFVIEDIFYYRGICLKKSTEQEKLDFLFTILSAMNARIQKEKGMAFTLPIYWESQHDTEYNCILALPDDIKSTIGYPVHHIQYRSFHTIVPYLNVPLNRSFQLQQSTIDTPTENETVKTKTTLDFDVEDIEIDLSKPQYKYPTVFLVTADIQFDIYHLYAYGKNRKPTYYGVAGIPNYKTSVFMNSLFRNIKENINLDYIEESDDEEEFENIKEDKFVDINKTLLMECIFCKRTKKWVPYRSVENTSRYINLSKLIVDHFSHGLQHRHKHFKYQHQEYNSQYHHQNRQHKLQHNYYNKPYPKPYASKNVNNDASSFSQDKNQEKIEKSID